MCCRWSGRSLHKMMSRIEVPHQDLDVIARGVVYSILQLAVKLVLFFIFRCLSGCICFDYCHLCKSVVNLVVMLRWFTSDLFFIYLFGVLCRIQHCTGHITTGSWKDRGNQYIQLVKVLYCKLPTNGKQLPVFPLEAMLGTEPRPQGNTSEDTSYLLRFDSHF